MGNAQSLRCLSRSHEADMRAGRKLQTVNGKFVKHMRSVQNHGSEGLNQDGATMISVKHHGCAKARDADCPGPCSRTRGE